MARQISLDLVLESRLYPERNGQNPPLLTAFTPREGGGNPLALARSLRTSDALSISIYTIGRDTGFQISGLSLQLSFYSAHNGQTVASPLDQLTYDRFNIFPAFELDRHCHAIDEPANETWNVFPSSLGNVYPKNQLQNDTRPVGDAFASFQQDGAFLYTARLAVELVGGQTVTFLADPEMIVKTNGAPGGGNGGD